VRAVTKALPEFVERYASFADFLAVYIIEAHARDQWPAGKISTCTQPTTNQERLELANTLVESKQVTIPLLVDPIENGFEEAFAAWPIRFYILHQEKVLFKAQPSGVGYDLEQVFACLDQFKLQQPSSSSKEAGRRGTKRRVVF